MIEVFKQMVDALENPNSGLVPHGGDWRSIQSIAIQAGKKAIAELESQEPVAVKRMKEWVEFLKRQSDNGQHMNIPSGLSAGTCWEIAIELEQFINTTPPQRTWVELTEEELRTAFGKLYPNDIGILELAENNKDYAVEAIGARHHWTAFKAGARAGEAKLKEKNI